MQTLELKILQTLNVTYEVKPERYEGGRKREAKNDTEIKTKKLSLWDNNCTYIVNIHIILTVNPKR